MVLLCLQLRWPKKMPAIYLLAKQKGNTMDKDLSKAFVPKIVVANWEIEIIDRQRQKKGCYYDDFAFPSKANYEVFIQVPF